MNTIVLKFCRDTIIFSLWLLIILRIVSIEYPQVLSLNLDLWFITLTISALLLLIPYLGDLINKQTENVDQQELDLKIHEDKYNRAQKAQDLINQLL